MRVITIIIIYLHDMKLWFSFSGQIKNLYLHCFCCRPFIWKKGDKKKINFLAFTKRHEYEYLKNKIRLWCICDFCECFYILCNFILQNSDIFCMIILLPRKNNMAYFSFLCIKCTCIIMDTLFIHKNANSFVLKVNVSSLQKIKLEEKMFI